MNDTRVCAILTRARELIAHVSILMQAVHVSRGMFHDHLSLRLKVLNCKVTRVLEMPKIPKYH